MTPVYKRVEADWQWCQPFAPLLQFTLIHKGLGLFLPCDGIFIKVLCCILDRNVCLDLFHMGKLIGKKKSTESLTWLLIKSAFPEFRGRCSFPNYLKAVACMLFIYRITHIMQDVSPLGLIHLEGPFVLLSQWDNGWFSVTVSFLDSVALKCGWWL